MANKFIESDGSIMRVPGIVFGLYLVVVLGMVVCLPPFIEYVTKQPFAPFDLFWLIGGVVLGFVLVLGVHAFSKRFGHAFLKQRPYYLFLLLGAALLLICQHAIIMGGFFKTDWDVLILTDFDDALPAKIDYFSEYPNQLLLAGLFRRIARLGALFGINDGYLCVVAIGALCVTYSVVASSLIAKKLAGFPAGYATFAIAFVFIGLSPWILVPYSDTYAMAFVATILLAYVCVEKPIIKWPVILAFSYIGYRIKPTVIFLLLSIAVLEALKAIIASKRNEARNNAPARPRVSKRASVSHDKAYMLGASALALCISVGFVSWMSDFGEKLDEQKAFGAAHYLMMGLNTEGDSYGAWSYEDTLFSRNTLSVQERTAADLERLKERLNSAGFVGVSKLLVRKTVSNYADGTFGWEREGTFYYEAIGENAVVKSIYGIDDVGAVSFDNNTFAPFFQIIWFLLLVGVTAACFLAPGSTKIQALFLSFFMLSVFLTLFECRARYLLLYAPCYVILGVLGWRYIAAIYYARTANQEHRIPNKKRIDG